MQEIKLENFHSFFSERELQEQDKYLCPGFCIVTASGNTRRIASLAAQYN